MMLREEEIEEGLDMIIGDEYSTRSILESWVQLSTTEKRNMLSVTENAVVNQFLEFVPLEERNLLDAGAIKVRETTIRMAQACLVQAIEVAVEDMEDADKRKRSKVPKSTEEEEAADDAPPSISITIPKQLLKEKATTALRYYIFVSTLFVLEQKLLLQHELSDLRTKVVFIIFYLAWRSSPWPWCSVLAILVVVMCRESKCKALADQFTRVVDALLVHSTKANVVVWHSEMYIAGTLLVLLNNSTRMYLLIGSLSVLPHVIGEVEKYIADSADAGPLKYIRIAFTMLNKLLLLYISWSSWSSLLLATVLFFKTMAVALFYGLLIAVASAVSFFIMLTRRLMPAPASRFAIKIWTNRTWKLAIYVGILICGALVYYTSKSWGSVWRPICRLVVVASGILVLYDVACVWPKAANRVMGALILCIIVPLALLERVAVATTEFRKHIFGGSSRRSTSSPGLTAAGGARSGEREYRWEPGMDGGSGSGE